VVKLTTPAIGELEWSQTYSFLCLRDMDRNKITFTYMCNNVTHLEHHANHLRLVLIYSSVSIATRYGLDGPGIESRWGRVFPQPSRPALGTTQPPVQWVPFSFPG
jgi:hypothetical protein